jgi:hypothetical protein
MPPTVLGAELAQRPIPAAAPAAPAIVSDNGVPLPADGPELLSPLPNASTTPWPGTALAPWTWQAVPDGLMYKSYLAGLKEPRLGTQWVHEKNDGWLWDSTLGARVGLLRYGTQDALWPEGWQIDVEGAAFPRLDSERNLVSVDFRAGVPVTMRIGHWESKFAYYHMSSHLGDEFMLSYDDFARTHFVSPRLNYARETLVLGLAFRPTPDWRLYGEAGWAFYEDGGSRPWEFQFGVEYSPAQPTGFRWVPFLAVNGAVRQEADYGGNLTVQTGLQLRSHSGRLARVGVQYFNGKSEQRQFFRDFEEQIGAGLWYDF